MVWVMMNVPGFLCSRSDTSTMNGMGTYLVLTTNPTQWTELQLVTCPHQTPCWSTIQEQSITMSQILTALTLIGHPLWFSPTWGMIAAFSVCCIMTRTCQWRNPSVQVHMWNGWIRLLTCFWLGPSWTFLSWLILVTLKWIKFFLTMAHLHLYLWMKCHHLFLPHQSWFWLRRIHPKTRLHLSFLPSYLSTVESHMNTMVRTTKDSLLANLAGPTILVLRHISRRRWRIGVSIFPICLYLGGSLHRRNSCSGPHRAHVSPHILPSLSASPSPT